MTEPGNSPGLTELVGNVTIGNESIFKNELGGTESGKFDQLFIIGDLNLAGTLDVSLLPNFHLQAKQYFEIINVTGSLTGIFSQLNEGDWVGKFGNTDVYITYSFGGGNDDRECLHQLLKFGFSANYWNEYVLQAYHHHQAQAIFLAGIPDLKATLPHA